MVVLGFMVQKCCTTNTCRITFREEGESTIYDVPALVDVNTIIEVLTYIGAEVNYVNETVKIKVDKIQKLRQRMT